MSRSALARLGLVFGLLVHSVGLTYAQQPAAVPAAPTPTAGTPATPADVASLVGEWALAMESPMGPSTTTMVLRVDAGKVVADLSSEMMPKTTISDIKKSGANIVISYSFDMQGQAIPILMTLSPKGETLGVDFNVADGMFQMTGVGTKKKA